MGMNLFEHWRNLAEAEAASREQALEDIALLIRRYEIGLEEIKALCNWSNLKAQRPAWAQSESGFDPLLD